MLIALELFHPANFTEKPGMYAYLSHPEQHSADHYALGYFGPHWWFALHMTQTPMVGLVAIGLWRLLAPVGVPPSIRLEPDAALRIGSEVRQPRWVDFWGSHDPAPCGALEPEFPMFDEAVVDRSDWPGKASRSIRVLNRRSVLHDHGAELECHPPGALDLRARERLRAHAVDLHQGPPAPAQLDRHHQHRPDAEALELGELGRVAERVAGHYLADAARRDQVRRGGELLQRPRLAVRVLRMGREQLDDREGLGRSRNFQPGAASRDPSRTRARRGASHVEKRRPGGDSRFAQPSV